VSDPRDQHVRDLEAQIDALKAEVQRLTKENSAAQGTNGGQAVTLRRWFRKQFGALPPTDAQMERLYGRLDEATWKRIEAQHQVDLAERLRAQWRAACCADARMRGKAKQEAKP